MNSIATYYDGSFDSVGFWIQEDDGGTRPDFSRQVSIEEHKYVYSGDITTTANGYNLERLELNVSCDTAQYTSLRSSVSAQATLVYHVGTVSNVRLEAISNARQAGTLGIWYLTLTLSRYV